MNGTETGALGAGLILMSLLLVKHLLADFFLQTRRMLAGRDAYLHLGRAQHAGLHAVLSAVCLLLVGAAPGLVLILCLAEAVLHYHIDWGKGVHAQRTRLGPADAGYWRAFGTDQLLHQLTYVAMVWLWAAQSV